jgi:hypothetical protein
VKLKSLRRRVWCSEQAKCLSYHVGGRQGGSVVTRSGRVRLPSNVRCPECGKRFTPRVRECDDPDCWHVYLPPHKKVIKVSRK